MNTVQVVVAVALIIGGLLLMLAGSIGILRLPDFYCRTHASSKVDTVGIMVLLAGLAVYEGLTLTSAKLGIAMFFIALSNPVAVHALARAALRFGLKPWMKQRPREERVD